MEETHWRDCLMNPAWFAEGVILRVLSVSGGMSGTPPVVQMEWPGQDGQTRRRLVVNMEILNIGFWTPLGEASTSYESIDSSYLTSEDEAVWNEVNGLGDAPEFEQVWWLDLLEPPISPIGDAPHEDQLDPTWPHW